MSFFIPFFRVVAPLLLCVLSACTHRQITLRDLPLTINPMADIPELRAWNGDTPLRMGADSACALPVVVFPELAACCERLGPRRDGFVTAPLRISLIRGKEPIVAYSHVVTAIGTPVQGLIGWPAIGGYIWHLDLRNRRHYFHRTLPQEVYTWESLPLRRHSDVARVDLPGCGECIIDTGAPYGLYLSPAEWKGFLQEHPEVHVGIYHGESPAAGGSFSRHYAWVRQLQMGPWVFRNIRVCESFSPLTGPRLLGREALAQYDIWIDGPSLRLYYLPL